jgi:predicted RNA-binding Zn ribbon-like protein
MMPMTRMSTIDELALVGNHPALDLTNTASWSEGAPRSDRLIDYPALVRWGLRAGLINSKQATALRTRAAARPRQAARTLHRARSLRQALHDVFAAHASGSSVSPEILARLNKHVAAALAHGQISKVGEKGAFTWTWDALDALDSVLWPIAQSAVDLLTSTDRMARVRVCAGEHCGWLFLDSSKRGARRWCRMSECGNRAKVRRFRERRS